ncbi:MAG: hypothetical protein ACKVOL_05485 [Novosphingobium sp.]
MITLPTPSSRQDFAITAEPDQALGRTERRFLRRIFNGCTAPVMADGRPFLTYKEASRYLLSLAPEARARAYAQMKGGAADPSGSL